MCGIVAAVSNRNIVPVLVQGLQRLEYRGYDSCGVAVYAGGLQRLLTGSYALCLLDYRLGDGDGLQLLAEAKAQKCATPIILITGDTREETDLAAMEGGAADFINKGDVKADVLERAIDYAIKTAQTLQQLHAAKKGPSS